MKRSKLAFFTLLFSLLVFACNAPSRVAFTATVPPIRPAPPAGLPSATQTLPTIPSVVTHVPLQTTGPILVYLDQVDGGTVIKRMDAVGIGQSSLPYPINASPLTSQPPLSKALSPDGDWLAYYSGSAGTCFSEVRPGTNDLTLNLVNVADGTIRVVTPLLSNGYPDIFTRAAQEIGSADVSAEMLQQAFICGITDSLDWSPDGQTLAFAGQMDGLSSDLYIYKVGSGEILRYSSGPQEIEWITWSPDGKWILDGSSYSVGEGMQYNIFATSADGATIKQLSSGTPAVVNSWNWLDEQRYFDSNGANGPGAYDLKLVDVSTGDTSEIWQGSYGSFDFVPYGNWLVLFANTPTWPYAGSDFQPGIFLIDANSLKQTRVNPLPTGRCCTFKALGHFQDHLFLVQVDPDQSIQYLSADAKLSPGGMQAGRIYVSPDRLTWISVSDSIQFFSDDGTLIRTVSLSAGMDPNGIGAITWRPDSSGLFFTYKYPPAQDPSQQVYLLERDQGNPVEVDMISSSFPDNFTWVAASR
jgi:Tol biopolymer transport system component